MSIQRDIDAELRFHFEARIGELTAQGMTRDDAHTRAVAEFGDVDGVRATLREIDDRVARRRNRLERLDGLRQDIVYAARALRRTPAVSLTIILTLTLGLGVNAAMFSLLDAIFLRPPAAVARPGELRRVWLQQHDASGVRPFWPGFDYAGYAAIAAAVGDRAGVTYYQHPGLRKLGRGEQAPSVGVAGAAATYFSLLGVKPQIGRFYSPSEDRVDTPTPVVVISDAFWKRELGGTSAVLGRVLTLSKEKFTVIGVASPDFRGTELEATDAWIPMAASIGTRAGKLQWWKTPNVNGFQVLLRPRSDVHESEILSRITAALRQPGIGFITDTAAIAAFSSIIAARGPGDSRTEMRVATRLAGVAVIVLLIAVANVVNLLLARAMQRRREIAVRLALGVSRARLVRLLVTESVLLAAVAAGAAVVAAVWGGALLRRLLMPGTQFAAETLDARTLSFALVLALAAGALAGLVPALRFASPELTSALKAGSRDGVTRRSRLRDSLVVLQAALSVVLLVGAVLFVRSLRNVEARDIGYAVDQLVFATISYDTKDSARDVTLSAQLQALAPRVVAIPGVQHVALTSMRPRSGFTWVDGWVPDFDTAGKNLPPGIYTAVSSDYFATTGTRLLRGRTFEAAPVPHAAYTAIVNQAMANALWPAQDPIGHCIYFKGRTSPCATVIGVAQTALLGTIGEKERPQFYVSVANPPLETWGANDIIVRADHDRIFAIERSLRTLLAAEFPGSIPTFVTMSEAMEPEYRPWRLGATLFTLFGLLALVVAGIGIYSTASYAVSERTREFGIRVALGARTVDVLRQVLAQGLRTVALGVVIGILMALAGGRLIAALLYEITPSDPAAMSVVVVILLAIATLATLIPAGRAARADPIAALRAE